MADEKNTPMETADDLAAEKEHQAVPKEEELRDHFVKEFGFDPEADKERLDKLVQHELGNRTKLSKAIGTKIKYRTDLEAAQKVTPPKPEKGLTPEDVSRQVAEELEKRELGALEYPDDIKAAIKQVAKINGVTIREALADPYIQAKVSTWKKDQGADEAAVTRNDKSRSKADIDLTPPDVDLTTEKGRKEYDEWKEKMIKKGY